ncbi:RHS repeat-associated core domain-containing protein, partial [Gallibacterium anatis]
QAQRQIVQHQDIYQKGHKLHRLNENYYEYDKAGRLVTKVEKRDGFRKQETHYRWNGKNELIGITTPKGEMWYYKYDAFGRRIAKECPQQHLRIEYLWDGDQLAYTQTFKNDELVSERHSVFNGFELIAQQDRYQQLKQTIDGNFIEWKFETNYAIVQPNGKVLGLLAPNGKLSWRAQNKSLWGLTFSDYNRNSPLDPNLLFAGQYYDEESGLTYNRFRYYDPETSNYLSSDPIGLLGGETPYSYVHNALDFLDPFGLARCPVGFKGSNGLEFSVTGYTDLSHYKTSDLKSLMYLNSPSNPRPFGKSPIDKYGNTIILHHYKQSSKGPIIAMPQKWHQLNSKNLHPFGNKSGINNRQAFNQWKREFWYHQAKEELAKRGEVL